jgi:pimeloyl-ACP methyl ester carboxylesterase
VRVGTYESAVPRSCRGFGAAPPVVLVHGVGFGPETLVPIADALGGSGRAIVIARRGYGNRAELPPARTVDEHVADVIEVLDGTDVERAVIAGISGGATVALAMALAHPERTAMAVAHEPAVGTLVPELPALVRSSLAAGGGRELVRVLAGPRTWQSLPAALIAAVTGRAELIESDARAFLAFEPSPGGGARLITSVGSRSDPLRSAVAQRLAGAFGASVEVIPECGHLPQFDAPQAFAELILDHVRSPI